MLKDLDKILTKENLLKADTECKIIRDACPGIDECLIKYIWVVGTHLNIPKKDIGHLARCPAIFDDNYKLKRLSRKNDLSISKSRTRK